MATRRIAKTNHPVQKLFAAFNSPRALKTHCTDECASELRARISAAKKEFPDVEYSLGNVVKRKDRIGFQYTATGTHKEKGKVATWCGSGFARVKKGKITAVHVFEDHWGKLLDLGIVPTTPEDDISGVWKGELYGVPFSTTLKQSPSSQKVTGTITALGQTKSLSGTNDPPSVSLKGGSGSKSISLSGTWADANTINGTLNGSGFKNQSVVLTRQ